MLFYTFDMRELFKFAIYQHHQKPNDDSLK